MPKDLITKEDVMQAIINRITSGVYGIGDRLPSVRQLADEIGSNRNTINKAYKMLLELGIIEISTTGRRGYSVKSVDQLGKQTKDELLEYFYQRSINLVWQGMAAGITHDEMLDQLKTAFGEIYGYGKLRIIFFECNEHDVTEMCQGLISALELPIEGRVLDNSKADLLEISKNYDLIITTFHHLAEITETIEKEGGSTEKIIGIETRPTSETMLRVARLPNDHIGLVCTIQASLHMLKHIFFGYHPEWNIETATIEFPDRVREIAKNCDHLIVTHTSEADVLQMTGRAPDVVIEFHIAEQSVSYLSQRIYQMQIDKMKHFQSLIPENQDYSA